MLLLSIAYCSNLFMTQGNYGSCDAGEKITLKTNTLSHILTVPLIVKCCNATVFHVTFEQPSPNKTNLPVFFLRLTEKFVGRLAKVLMQVLYIYLETK